MLRDYFDANWRGAVNWTCNGYVMVDFVVDVRVYYGMDARKV